MKSKQEILHKSIQDFKKYLETKDDKYFYKGMNKITRLRPSLKYPHQQRISEIIKNRYNSNKYNKDEIEYYIRLIKSIMYEL